jgi:hypothetical protein
MNGIKQAARVMEKGVHQFIAYRQRDDGLAVSLGTVSAVSLQGALADLAQFGLAYKDTLFVHERHDGLRFSTLHVYRIRKGAATYQRNPQTGLSERVEPLKLDRLFSIPVDAFQPTRPFDAFRDDPTGVDLTLIEGRTMIAAGVER